MGGDRTVGELLSELGRRAPFAKAAAWDPVGLQIGDPAASAGSLALCHEVTESVVAALEAEPVDLLIAYHPLLFRPTNELVAGPTPAGRALRLVRAGVGLCVLHTNFDVARGGAADALAEALGLPDTAGFGPVGGSDTIKIATFAPAETADAIVDAASRAGACVIGNYTHCSFRSEGVGTFHAGAGTDPAVGQSGALNREPEVRIEFVAPRALEHGVVAAVARAHPYEEPAYDVFDRRGDAGFAGRIGAPAAQCTLADLAERSRSALGGPALRIAGARDRVLERVAVVPGAGGDFAPLAAEGGADALVTGDLSHHTARAALDRGLCLIDPGHAATERPGLARLLGWLRELVPDCASLLAFDPDPWTGSAAGTEPPARTELRG